MVAPSIYFESNKLVSFAKRFILCNFSTQPRRIIDRIQFGKLGAELLGGAFVKKKIGFISVWCRPIQVVRWNDVENACLKASPRDSTSVRFGLGTTFPPFDFQHKWKASRARINLCAGRTEGMSESQRSSRTRINLYAVRTEGISESQRSSRVRTALISFRIYLRFLKNFLTVLTISAPESFPEISTYDPHSTDAIPSTRATSQQVVRSTRISLRVWKSHRNRLVCWMPSTYAGSWKEGMSYRVRIARFNLCDSNLPLNPNHVKEFDSCVGCLLLMLEAKWCKIQVVQLHI